ncbi:hypothetical protein [Paratractidigestivibacter faecalis]
MNFARRSEVLRLAADPSNDFIYYAKRMQFCPIR